VEARWRHAHRYSQDFERGRDRVFGVHHSLAMASLIDLSVVDDGVSITNRDDESTGTGYTQP